MQIKEKEWFTDWFDSPYYHILYKNRDKKEAALFIDNLCTYLQLQKGDKILDLACGKGRHSIYLNSKGYNVTGTDLSESSITHAKKSENESLHFQVCDMRELDIKEEFKIVLNLFTSFGYFNKEEDNIKTLQNIHKALIPGGMLVIDFMNTHKVINSLVSGECTLIDGIDFCISRKVQDGIIIKEINFNSEGQEYNFEERVQALMYNDFVKYFNFTGFETLAIFGDYNLRPYNPNQSERMIWITQKK